MGFVCLWDVENRKDMKRISHLKVKRGHRGEGVGSALLDRAVQEAKKSDKGRLSIYVKDGYLGLIEGYDFTQNPEGSQAKMEEWNYFVMES
ncbi:MAG: GNAT family N-acetyltransferase [Halobacteria archaeon]